jgi:hypothetical protein
MIIVLVYIMYALYVDRMVLSKGKLEVLMMNPSDSYFLFANLVGFYTH